MDKPSEAAKSVGKLWGEKICRRAGDIDPDSEQDWRSMWIGFAIASGLSIEEATSYGIYMAVAFTEETT